MSSATNRNAKKRSRRTGIDSLITKAATGAPSNPIRFRLIKGPSITSTADPVDPKAPSQSFPLVAKFPIQGPTFDSGPLRLYQRNVPKAIDSSDEETTEQPSKKRRWRRRQTGPPPREWQWQTETEFLASMVAAKNRDAPVATTQTFTGTSEFNPSRFCLFSADADGNIAVRSLPPQMTIACKTTNTQLQTLTKAEHALDDAQRMERMSNRSKLLKKMETKQTADPETTAEDVMADLTYRHRKASKGRQELLNAVGDGIAVSHEGVLGGTNDAMFGGDQKFGNFQAKVDKNKKSTTTTATTERGADGAAMADDFYTRDVQAEYNELDFDANELFDDDDVDIGETEVVNEDGAIEDEEEEQDDEGEESAEEEDMTGALSLASKAGFQAMLAKARGEDPASLRKRKAENIEKEDEDTSDHVAKIRAAAAKQRKEADAAAAHQQDAPPTESIKSMDSTLVQKDENGLRILTQAAVRRELWLNHGKMQLKQIMNLFSVKKGATKERKAKFTTIIKELCVMTDEGGKGNKFLVLKQHYANM